MPSSLLFAKLSGAAVRAADALRLLPRRLLRLGRHLLRGGRGDWWLEAALLVLEAAAVGEIFETLADLFKFNTRPLREEEQRLAREIFGRAIDYRRVRLDEWAFLGTLRGRICYVSFCTINSWGAVPAATFLHEMTHVWQYQRMGIRYIPRALRAQFSPEGYDYGGADRLRDHRQQGRLLKDFNLEQQADIVGDYHRLRQGLRPRWGAAGPGDLEVYAYFIAQIRKE